MTYLPAHASPEPSAAPPLQFKTRSGTRIYQIGLPAYPGMDVHAFIVVAGDYAALVDAGMSTPQSMDALNAGMQQLRTYWGESVNWDSLQRIVITHGHVDHFGGLFAVRARTAAPVAVHPWDRSILEDPASALQEEVRQVNRLLTVAGVPTAFREKLIYIAQMSSPELRPVAVQDTMVDGELLDDIFQVLHAPGHRSGQVCLQIDDVVLCADHVLSNVRPRLVPHAFEQGSGLQAYLDALDRAEALPGISVALGGHGDPMPGFSFHARIKALRTSHMHRVGQVWEACAAPTSLLSIVEQLYKQADPLMLIFQLQAVATWTEYLCERGEMVQQPGEDGTLLFTRLPKTGEV